MNRSEQVFYKFDLLHGIHFKPIPFSRHNKPDEIIAGGYHGGNVAVSQVQNFAV